MEELGAFVIGHLQGAYVMRVTIRGEIVEINHRPVDAEEREILRTSLHQMTPIVVQLGGDLPVRVRRREDVVAAAERAARTSERALRRRVARRHAR